MKKSLAIKCAAIFVLAAALLSLSTCEYFISNTIRVYNTSGIATVWAHIHYNEDDYTSEYPITNGNFYDFDIMFVDPDKYGGITVYVYNGTITESTSGNIAENDWLTVIYYDSDF